MGLEGSRSSRHGRDRWKMNVHGILLATQMCRKSTLELRRLEPTARSPYSAEAARNPAMSVMKAAANQSSSGEWEDHGSSTGYRVPQF
jgi:hypothetical protein